MNEFLFFISVIFSLLAVLLSFKFFGKIGLFAWVVFASILANIEVLKCVNIFSLETTLGNAMFGSVFLAVDMLNEFYGKDEAKKAVFVGFTALFSLVLFSQLDILFIPSSSDFIHNSFVEIFGIVPRVCLGSMVAFLMGNMLSVRLYDSLKAKNGEKLLWLRNNLSTLLAQLIDNFILFAIAFGGVYSFSYICLLSISSWVIEVFVAVLDTPFIYMARKIKNEEKKGLAVPLKETV